MPIIAKVERPKRKRPDGQVPGTYASDAHATLFSMNGGIVLALCALVTAIALGSVTATDVTLIQKVLFTIFAAIGWLYLVDSATEKLALRGDHIVLASAVSALRFIDLHDVCSLTLRHEGLNARIGIASLIVKTTDGARERLPLGPCWRQGDLEAFLASVSLSTGYAYVVHVDA